MKRNFILCVMTILAAAAMTVQNGDAAVRLKDVATIKDNREIQLYGIGLITGLDGTGDKKNTQSTIRMYSNMMLREGLDLPTTQIKLRNVAAVMVNAKVSPYIKEGGMFDVTVSSAGDARSLEGGVLQITHLKGPDGKTYAVAQGPINIGGLNRDYNGDGDEIEQPELTGRIPNGGILMREVPTMDVDERMVMVTLHQPDYTTAYRLATAINTSFQRTIATARDAGSINIMVPSAYSENSDLVRFIAEIEMITFIPDERARVVINERTGTIVAGANVTVSPVAIMHGTLNISVEDLTPQFDTGVPGQVGVTGAPGAEGAPGLPVEPTEPEQIEEKNMFPFSERATVGDVAQALNIMGASPRDVVAIFQALKEAGALRAELVFL